MLKFLLCYLKSISVLDVGDIDCRRNGPVILRQPHQLIGSITTEETGCGNTENPWMIELKPGQKINITMMDYGLGADNLTTNSLIQVSKHVVDLGPRSYLRSRSRSKAIPGPTFD